MPREPSGFRRGTPGAVWGWDGDEFNVADIDASGGMRTRHYVWNADTLAWEAVTTAGVDATAGYKISDIDSGSPSYYGYVNIDGAWFIMRESSGAYRYAKGSSDYTTNWTNRASLEYDYFHLTF